MIHTKTTNLSSSSSNFVWILTALKVSEIKIYSSFFNKKRFDILVVF